MQAGGGAAETGTQQFRQRRDDERAEDRDDDRAEAADSRQLRELKR